jgi:hypothetical protein
MPSITRDLTDYLLVASFLVTAAMLFQVSGTVRLARKRKLTHDNPRFWMGLAGVFLVFACVKAANVFAFAGTFMRVAARTEGVYNERRPVQLLALGLISLASFVGVCWLFANRGLAHRHWPLLVCVGLIAAFAAARFVSLHQFDAAMARLPWLRSGVELLASLIPLYLAISRHIRLRARLHRLPSPV